MLIRCALTSPVSDPFTTNVQALAGGNIAHNLALHNDFTRSDGGGNLSILADRYAMSGKVD